jgi:hypothetical protein
MRATCPAHLKKNDYFYKFKNRRHSWIGHTIRHNEFVVNILEGAIFGGKKCSGKIWAAILTASGQKHNS